MPYVLPEGTNDMIEKENTDGYVVCTLFMNDV
jgi:hypothetical protein